MNNPYLPTKAEIIKITPETETDYTFRLSISLEVQNGQFIEVSLPRVGEAPISVSDFGKDYIDLTIRRCGVLTNVIHTLKVGDFMYVRGPYGKGFPIEGYKGKQLIIASGGTGLAPVKSIVRYFYEHLEEVEQFDLLCGFRSPKDVLFTETIEAWKQRFNVIATVDQGDETWTGNVGLITKLVPELEIKDLNNIQVVVVGPPAMMHFTCLEFLKRGVKEEDIWVSYERKMCCGIGKCGHCKIDDTYICLEGPVFNYVQAKNLMD